MNMRPPRCLKTLLFSFPVAKHCYYHKDVCKFLHAVCGHIFKVKQHSLNVWAAINFIYDRSIFKGLGILLLVWVMEPMPVNLGKSFQHSRDSHTLGIVSHKCFCMVLSYRVPGRLFDAELKNFLWWKVQSCKLANAGLVNMILFLYIYIILFPN